MASLRDVAAYFCKYGSASSSFDAIHLTMLVFLADWHGALAHGNQITNTQWQFNEIGPFAPDVLDTAKLRSDTFSVIHSRHGFRKRPNIVLSCHPVWVTTLTLTTEDIAIITNIIDLTKDMTVDVFLWHIHDTYPVRTRTANSPLDLGRIADEFQHNKHEWNHLKMQQARRKAIRIALDFSASKSPVIVTKGETQKHK